MNFFIRFFHIAFCLSAAWLLALPGHAQVFTADEFMSLVRSNHPIAQRANLVQQRAEAELMAARGQFDPQVMYNTQNKTLDGTNYYRYNNFDVKLPTWFGLDVKGGIEDNSGARLNPEASRQMSYLGLELPLARGLLLDYRRADVLQARINLGASEFERLNYLNNLLFDAYVTYWDWAGRYNLYQTFNTYLANAQQRIRFTRIQFQNGDKSEMDTLEALTQYQNIQLQQAEALLDYRSAAIRLSNYLWLPGTDSAFLIPATLVPDTIAFQRLLDPPNLPGLLSTLNLTNPELRLYDFKLQGLDVDRRLYTQQLLPYVTGKYQLLNKDQFVFNKVGGQLFENNYRFGLDVKIPLFFREGRGNLRAVRIKLQETRFDLLAKRREVETKVQDYVVQYNVLQQQLGVAQSAYDNYRRLLRNEELRFANGESSLFLINSRENKALETLQKAIELRIKYFKARYSVDWAAGVLR